MNIKSDLREHKDKIDNKLIQRIRMLTVILFVMTGVLVYEIITSHISIIWVFFGVILGISIGFFAGRMFFLEWHEEKKKVIGRLDLIGIIVLVIYITLSIARHWIFAYWFAGSILTAFTFSFVEGAMLGRILSMRFNIKRVLMKQGF